MRLVRWIVSTCSVTGSVLFDVEVKPLDDLFSKGDVRSEYSDELVSEEG